MVFDSELSVRNLEPVGKPERACEPGLAPGVSKTAVMVRAAGLGRVYATDAGNFAALTDVNLEIEEGQFVAIVGKSGSGKSTLLNVLSGIDRPTSGAVYIAGVDLSAMSESDLARWRGANVGFVFQFHQLMPTLTIAENVMMPMDFAGTIPRKRRTSRSLDLLDRVGIADQANKFPAELSGGQQQRAAIARALANKPTFVAADEPTGNLDSQTADAVLQLFRELTAEGTTVVIVTHEREIRRSVDRVITVTDGTIANLTDGTIANLTDGTIATGHDAR